MRWLGVVPLVLCGVVTVMAVAVCNERGSREQFEVRHGSVVVDVSVSRDATPMRHFTSRTWTSADAPVIAHVRTGTTAPVTIWATPSYGVVDLPGRHVDVTYLARYRADGDRQDAEPVRSGVPLRPDPRRTDGSAAIDLPLTSGVALKLSLVVRHGMAYTALQNEQQRSSNVTF